MYTFPLALKTEIQRTTCRGQCCSMLRKLGVTTQALLFCNPELACFPHMLAHTRGVALQWILFVYTHINVCILWGRRE